MGTAVASPDAGLFARIAAVVELEEDSVAGVEALTTLSSQCKIQVRVNSQTFSWCSPLERLLQFDYSSAIFFLTPFVSCL